jgi:threonine dehydratase
MHMDLLADGIEPGPVTRVDIETAAERIMGRVRRTPVQELGPFALGGIPGELVLKLELLQYTGSFKPRGAFNRMLAAEVDEAGVIAASGGNFGLAVAFAAHELEHRAEIFVPETSPSVKIDRIRALGAEVTVVPGYYADAATACEERALESSALFMHPYDQFEVVAGQGTIAMELSEQCPGADTVVVAVGGGGLVAGIAAWYANDTRVVGVEPERSPTMSAALAAGRPVDVEVAGVAADSLGARRAGDIAHEICDRFLDAMVTVPDEAIVDAQRRLWHDVHLVAEPGAAAALAALLCGAYDPEPDERVVVVVCGANTDPATVA